MSGAGGVGGVGGSGGAHATPTPTAAQSSDAVTPAKGASGVSDDGGKDSLTIGDGNLIGNTQNQTINVTNNNYNMSSGDFCSLSGMGESQGIGGSSQAESNMSNQEIQNLLMMMLIMMLIEALMNNMDGGGQGGQGGGGQSGGGGFEASIEASSGGGTSGGGGEAAGGRGGFVGTM